MKLSTKSQKLSTTLFTKLSTKLSKKLLESRSLHMLVEPKNSKNRYGTIHIITSAKNWVVGTRILPFLLTFVPYLCWFNHLKLVGGSEKVQNYADVIYGWCELFAKWSLFGILFVILSTERVFLQVILFEIDCASFYTNLHELFSQFISWTNWVNSGM